MIWKLIKFEWQNDIRHKASIVGIVLYIFTILFFCLQSFKKIPEPLVWNNLFWVVLIFSAINSTSKNFNHYNRGRFIYLYSVVKAEHFILAKISYQILFTIVLTAITLFIYGLFLGFKPLINANIELYVYTLLLGTIGFSAILTLVSLMTVKANASQALTAVLAIPLIIPLIIAITELSTLAINNLPINLASSSIWIVTGCDLFVLALAFLLFPYLWRE